MFKPLIDWYMATLSSGGYPLVALLMAIESSIVPLPSELVIPPAAHLAWRDGMQFLGIQFTGWPAQIGLVIAGALGSWLGATAMYGAARWLGRPLVLRYGKYIFISSKKIHGAERWAAHYGSMGIFISRLLPVVRHLVGIPAGIVKMNYAKFSLYTLLGSAHWSAVLCYVGVAAGQDEKLMAGEFHRIATWLAGAAVVLGGIYYVFVHRHMKGSHNSSPPPQP